MVNTVILWLELGLGQVYKDEVTAGGLIYIAKNYHINYRGPFSRVVKFVAVKK